MTSTMLFAQENDLSKCFKHFTLEYISDGQEYYAELNSKKNSAEFRATFFEGSTYRIAYCSSLPTDLIIFKLYDSEKNLLYSNDNYEYSPYWDFTFISTTDCILEVKVTDKNFTKAKISLLIGFKIN